MPRFPSTKPDANVAPLPRLRRCRNPEGPIWRPLMLAPQLLILAAMHRRRRYNLMPFLVLFGGALAWAGSAGGTYHTPFLFNRTAAPADVRITWVLRRVPCATTPQELAATLAPSDLGDPLAVTLDSGEVATLGGPPPAGTSAVGVCASPYLSTSNPDPDCRAAILESAGATPVLMVAPQNWYVASDTYVCSPSPSSASKCAPKLDPHTDGGDDALSLMSHGGALSFEVLHPGGADRSIRIAPIDPAAIAGRPATSDGCRATRDAYRALAQSAACASDEDCQALKGLSIPGEVGACTLFVNKTVSAASVQTVASQWGARSCATGGPLCRAPLGVVCRAGTCAELCAGVSLPACDTSCDSYASDPKGVCATYFFGCSGSGEQCHPVCTDSNLQRCVCRNDSVVCEPRALIDPGCPVPCRR